MSRIAVLIVAAGKGARAGTELPKQYERLGGHADAAPDGRRPLTAIAVQVVIGPGPGRAGGSGPGRAGPALPLSPAAPRGRNRCGWGWKRWPQTRRILC